MQFSFTPIAQFLNLNYWAAEYFQNACHHEIWFLGLWFVRSHAIFYEIYSGNAIPYIYMFYFIVFQLILLKVLRRILIKSHQNVSCEFRTSLKNGSVRSSFERPIGSAIVWLQVAWSSSWYSTKDESRKLSYWVLEDNPFVNAKIDLARE
jgi:hypothetical protein